MPLEVLLVDYARDPLQKLYAAYRTCYSPKTPAEVWSEIRDGTISRDKVREFIGERLKTGHASPLEQVVFWFGISGVSRAFSHQFVRHRIGISFEQQSQRYVKFKDARFPYAIPESVQRAGMADKMKGAFEEIGRLYQELLDASVPAEDARFLLPNATSTNFK